MDDPELNEPGCPVRILSPDDEETRRIGKAVASNTAGDILRFMGDGEQTASRIAEALSLPISTVMYHLESLEKAGLIEVVRTRYSVKGRELKVYQLTRQILIVTPVRTDIKDLLIKYAALFLVPIVGFLFVALGSLMQVSQTSPLISEAYGGMTKVAEESALQDSDLYAMEIRNVAPCPPSLAAEPVVRSTDLISTGYSFPDLAIGILVGGLGVLVILGIIELIKWRRIR